MRIKEKIFGIINEKNTIRNDYNKFFNIIIIVLIALSVIQIILESFNDFRNKYTLYLRLLEIFTVIIFSLEYLLRLWTADLLYKNEKKLKSRIRFIFSASGIIDLIAILPFYLPLVLIIDLRFVRILRVTKLIRILKLNRYTKAFKIMGSVFREKKSELSLTVFITFILIVISSIIMFNLEHNVQKDAFPNIVSTFWWSVATLTTVGYGDVYPITGWGKLISGIIALLGIGLVALPTGIISAGFFDRMKKEKRKKEPFKFCPHCGEKTII